MIGKFEEGEKQVNGEGEQECKVAGVAVENIENVTCVLFFVRPRL